MISSTMFHTFAIHVNQPNSRLFLSQLKIGGAEGNLFIMLINKVTIKRDLFMIWANVCLRNYFTFNSYRILTESHPKIHKQFCKVLNNKQGCNYS